MDSEEFLLISKSRSNVVKSDAIGCEFQIWIIRCKILVKKRPTDDLEESQAYV